MKKILVAVDREKSTGYAVRRGVELAQLHGAQLSFVHALATPWRGIGALGGEEEQRLYEGELAREFAAHREFLAETLGAEEVLGRPLANALDVVAGRPAAVIVDHARRAGVDLLVLGGHRRSGKLEFGRTLRALFAHATCPLWIQAAPPAPVRTIVVPVDMSSTSGLALDAAAELARACGAKLVVCHVFSMSPLVLAAPLDFPVPTAATMIAEARAAAQKEFTEFVGAHDLVGLDVDADFREGTPLAQILESAERADLVAIGTHGKTGLSAAVLGHVSHAVVRRASCPVLAVREPMRAWLL